MPTRTTVAAGLLERYARPDGPVYLTGIQALVRLLLDQARADRAAGRDIGAFVSGYEGSPLAGFDLEMARRKDLLIPAGVVHQPGLNEELAATAVSGSQQARTAGLRGDGVTGFWYGKAPGLDRATDALRHANLMGTDPCGGAVALVGDDPAAKSSSVPCSSELALADLGMPTLVPADAGEILDLGRHAVEISRASGLWSALKIATVVADGASTAVLGTPWRAPALTELPGGLVPYTHRPSGHLLGATLHALERSFFDVRLPLATEYIRASGVNRILGASAARVGIVAAGPTYLALRQALDALGLREDDLARRGIRLLKLGALFPIDDAVIGEFATGLAHVLVVEDKRGYLEDAVRSALYGHPDRPEVLGKRDRSGAVLFEPTGELDADRIAPALRRALVAFGVDGLAELPRPRQTTTLPLVKRAPFFCSGCPHNSSTEVAPGTLVGAGIGCHALIMLMPGERAGTVSGLTQMGGEGTQWLGMAPFVDQHHFVQNLGDGTFAHSGSLAIRAAVAAGANMTFKVLRNSTVAMTGGQDPVGDSSLRELVALLQAERVAKVVVTTDEPRRARRQLGRGVQVRRRDELLEVQRELAQIEGVTVLVHDQECAAEKRRKRRRGRLPEPATRAFINERVCEGCGDCGAKSNCLSVQPVQTEYGRKTRINQSSCNVDLSCFDGDCPSFLAVTPRSGAAPARRAAAPPSQPATADELPRPLPDPEPVVPTEDFRMRITGIGGTGVVTVSQVLATAAALEGRFVRALDQTGLAQKGGAVVSDLTITAHPTETSPKLSAGRCDLYLGCEAVVAADPVNTRVAAADRTVAVVSSTQVPTAEMVVDPEQSYPDPAGMLSAIGARARGLTALDAAGLARQYFGDEQYANMLLVGAAHQLGALPVPAAAIEQAIGINGTKVELNVAAFRRGRQYVVEATAARTDAVPAEPTDAAALIRARAADLAAYQNRKYAIAFEQFLARVGERDRAVGGDGSLTVAAARGLYKLMAYKDEYEVARLSVDPRLREEVEQEFGTGARYRYRLHPPVLRALGMRRKIELGAWARPMFVALARLRVLRGTPFDPFGYAGVRRTERALVREYRELLEQALRSLTPQNYQDVVQLAELPDVVRGYESIKLANVERFRAEAAERLAALRHASDGCADVRTSPAGVVTSDEYVASGAPYGGSHGDAR